MTGKNFVMMKKTLAVALVAWSVANTVLADKTTSDKPLAFSRHEVVGARVETGEAGTVRVNFMPAQTNALVRLKPAEGTWNFDQAAAVLVDIRNRGAKAARRRRSFRQSRSARNRRANDAGQIRCSQTITSSACDAQVRRDASAAMG